MTLTVSSARFATADNLAYIAETLEESSISGVVGDALWLQIQAESVAVQPYVQLPPTISAIEAEAKRRIEVVEGIMESIRLIARYVKILRKAADPALTVADRDILDTLETRFKKITDILAAADALEVSRPQDFFDDRHWPVV